MSQLNVLASENINDGRPKYIAKREGDDFVMVGDEGTDLTLGVGVREGLLNLNRNLKRWVFRPFRPFRFGTQSGDKE